jgi:hypothetical protein
VAADSPNSRTPQPRASAHASPATDPAPGRTQQATPSRVGVWSPRVTGAWVSATRPGMHLAVYRLRAGDLAAAVKRYGQGSNP